MANFLDPLQINSGSIYNANGNLVPGATLISESGFNPNAAPVSTPELSSLLLLGAGLVGLIGIAKLKAVIA